MDLSTWTLTVVGIGVSLTALLFRVLQYLNTRGRPKRLVIKRALCYGFGISTVLYLGGLGVLSDRHVPISATTDNPVAVDIAPLQSKTNDAVVPQPQRPTSTEPFEVTVASQAIANASAADSELTLAYGYERLGSVLHVKPEMPYLSLLSRGGPIQGLGSSFRWTYPELSVKVVNNAPSTLFLAELIIRVTSSVINREPVITVGYETKDDLHIENFGWGKVLNPRLAFGIAPADTYNAVDPRSQSPDQSLKLDSFDSFVAVPVRDQILAFSTKRREQQEPELNSRSPGQTIKIMSMGERVCIYGTISYDTEEAGKRALYFKTIVYTGYTIFQAGMNVPSATYGVVLVAGRAGYTKRIPISQYVKSGDVDHFALRLLTDRSARFDLTLDVATAGGTVIHSRRLLLETFVPSVGGRPLELKDSPRITRDAAK